MQAQMSAMQARLDNMAGSGDSIEDNIARLSDQAVTQDYFLSNEMMSIGLGAPHVFN